MRVAPETRRGAAVAASAATQAKADTERELTLSDVKGSNSDPVWSEVPEELYFIANYAAALGGDYPPENVDKSYWEQIKPATYAKLAALAKKADPTTISSGQYLMLMEAIVRDAIAKDPKMSRPSMAEPTLTEQQEYIYNWIQTVPNAEFLKVRKKGGREGGRKRCSFVFCDLLIHFSCPPSLPPSFPSIKQFKEEYKLEDMSPADWWNKIDEIAKDNAAKGIKLPEVRLPFLPLPPCPHPYQPVLLTHQSRPLSSLVDDLGSDQRRLFGCGPRGVRQVHQAVPEGTSLSLPFLPPSLPRSALRLRFMLCASDNSFTQTHHLSLPPLLSLVGGV
jgi:hypothetical protein